MQHRLDVASRFTSILALTFGTAAAAAACGHLPFEDLPIDPDLDGSANLDGSSSLLDGGSADGRTDAPFPLDDGSVRDSGRDALIEPDGGCVGTDCKVIHVSSLLGNNENDGSARKPLKTIQAALKLISSERHVIKVAAGTYEGALPINQDLQLYGGYACSTNAKLCDWNDATRDHEANRVVIEAKDWGGGVIMNDKITRATEIDGIEVNGFQGETISSANGLGGLTFAMFGATPTVRRVVVRGSVSRGGTSLRNRRSVAVLIAGPQKDAAGPLIEDCDFHGGTADGIAAGVLFDTSNEADATEAPPAADIAYSRIEGGTGSVAAAVFLNRASSKTIIRDNYLDAIPPATPDKLNTAEVWAVVVNGAPTIEKNRINQRTNPGAEFCKSAQAWCGGIVTNNAVTTIRNNVILGLNAQNSAGVLIGTSNDQPAGSVVLNSNTIDPVGSTKNSSISAAVALKNTSTTKSIVGSVRNNILRGGNGKTMAAAVYETNMGTSFAHLATFDHNNAAAQTTYRVWDGNAGMTYEIDNYEGNIPVPGTGKNFDDKCELSGDFHLQGPSSPCIDTGTNEEAPLEDFDNPPTARPFNAKDIGADEWEQP